MDYTSPFFSVFYIGILFIYLSSFCLLVYFPSI